MEDRIPDLEGTEWDALEELAREAGKQLRREHIPAVLLDRGLVTASGCCWKLTKAGWCALMFHARERQHRFG